MFGAQGVDGVNIYSMFVAVVGAIIVLVTTLSLADEPFNHEEQYETRHWMGEWRVLSAN